jgi:cyclase
MTSSKLLATVAAVAGLLLHAAAAAAGEKSDIRITKLADHIYKLSYDVGYVVNMVASVGDDGVLLVDTGEREKAEQLRDAIRGLRDEVPRFIINTHAHVDHTGGNAAFGASPVVIAHQVLRTRLRSGSYLFDEVPDAALPDTTFTDSLTLRFNGEEIRILAFPGAHDDNDAIVWFTGSKLAAAGDLVYANGFPSVEEVTGNVLGYRDVLPRIMSALPHDVTFVCGHSEEGGFDMLERFCRAVTETEAIVERESRKGRSVAEMQQAKVLGDWEGFARGYVSIDEWIAALGDALRPATAVRTLYEPMYYSLRDGGVDAALATYDDLKRNHRDEYRFVENDLAFMADKLTRSGRMPEAIAFWGLYAREYPNGSLAWYCHYDLGKLYAVAGDRETALANYRKALELSPANPRVIEMMKELGGH